MYKVLLIDDEPLILAGITSLLDWKKYDCRIEGKATNGLQALEMMHELQPDIVITDIRMPAMSGLEFIKAAREQGQDAAYILLTNLEEFQLAKEAMSLGVIDYLVKLELTEAILAKSLLNAIEYCENNRSLKGLTDKKRGSERDGDAPKAEQIRNYFQKKLLYENDAFIGEMPVGLNECFREPVLVLLNFNFAFQGFSSAFTRNDQKKVISYAESILPEMVKRYFPSCCLMNWEQNSFLIIISAANVANWEEKVQILSDKIISVLMDYFGTGIAVAVSEKAESIEYLQELLYQVLSGMNYYYYDSSRPVVFYSRQCEANSRHTSNFNISLLKKDISKAIRQSDGEAIGEVIQQLIVLLEENKPAKAQAVNACCNLYFYIASFYEGDEDGKFPYAVNIIGELNQLASLNDIVAWLNLFCGQIVRFLADRKTVHRADRIIEQVRKYVIDHHQEKITLGQTAQALNISQGYLSSIFKKQTGDNFSDYVAEIKIEKAKELIKTHEYLMYEISDLLGFDNPYYFSRVFKKVTGYSPREYEMFTGDENNIKI